jgi:hypothetical protein
MQMSGMLTYLHIVSHNEFIPDTAYMANSYITKGPRTFIVCIKRTLLLPSFYCFTSILKFGDYKYFSSKETINKIL